MSKVCWGLQLKQSCANCRFSCSMEENEGLYCVRNPPNGAATPQVHNKFWCGEWQPIFTQDKLEPALS